MILMDYTSIAYNTLLNVWSKIFVVYKDTVAYSLTIILFSLISWFGAERVEMIKLVLIAAVLDLIWGVISSLKRKRFLCSRFFLATAVKVIIYATLFSIVAVIEKGISLELMWISKVLCAVICVSEFWSISAHILILKSNFPVLKLFRTVLAGEIAKKVGITRQSFLDHFDKDFD
jgi:hypothetical protein